MSKVSIKLQGGICNYLFQIAAAYSYAKKTNKELWLSKDDSVVVHKHIDYYKDNILSKIEFKAPCNYSKFKIFQEPGFHYSEIPEIEGDVYLLNYFQSEKYFKEYEDDIRKLFEFPRHIFDYVVNDVALNIYKINMSIDETCSIHVRRGDFLKFPENHPQQGMQYYMKAMKKIGMDKKFLVFSDDIQWCKENFPELDNLYFIEGLKDYEDLCLMSLCSHNIICNSTFSWWSAYLNKNASKQIIAPKQWFGNAYSNLITKDLYCDGWILI